MTARHVVPHVQAVLKGADVAFIEIQQPVKSVCNPLFVEHDTAIFERPMADFLQANFLETLETGSQIIHQKNANLGGGKFGGPIANHLRFLASLFTGYFSKKIVELNM